ncbi:MAG: hypothetical protein QF707_00345 [Candidatus Poseidoniaceae archaeon]|nr:hypothetical protein [Candidatus Poseidoniaceae archaeon]
MAVEVTLFLSASAISAVSNWASWHLVWRHEGSSEQKRDIKETLFWILFSYLLPFLPFIFIMLGEHGSDSIGPLLSKWSLSILCVLLGVLMSGQAMSSWSWKQREKADALPEPVMKHFNWTMGLTAASGIIWLILLFAFII